MIAVGACVRVSLHNRRCAAAMTEEGVVVEVVPPDVYVVQCGAGQVHRRAGELVVVRK